MWCLSSPLILSSPPPCLVVLPLDGQQFLNQTAHYSQAWTFKIFHQAGPHPQKFIWLFIKCSSNSFNGTNNFCVSPLLSYCYNTHDTSDLRYAVGVYVEGGGGFLQQPILGHRLDVQQFNSILTLPSWRQCQLPQIRDSFPEAHPIQMSITSLLITWL